MLLDRVANERDESAFLELYRELSGIVFATVYSILKDASEAEDVLQECFVTVWNRAAQYDQETGKAVSWILCIARNRAFDYHARDRKRKRAAHAVSDFKGKHDDARAERVDAFETLVSKETAKAIREALERLPSDQHDAIRLAFLEGLTQSEIAEHTNHPLGTIKARIRRGLLAMRQSLNRLKDRDA